MPDIQAVIFDWANTLWDSANLLRQAPVPGAQQILDYCSAKYGLALVSIARIETPRQRRARVERLGWDRYFQCLDIVMLNKDAAYERTAARLGVPCREIAVVDDMVHRGVAWGNRRGCLTIWLCRGRYAKQLPNARSGQPSYTFTHCRN